MMLAPSAAFAYGGNNNDRGDRRNDNRQVAAQADANKQNRDDRRGGNWWDWDRWHKTCEERQAYLNQKAADAQDKSQKKLNGVNIMLGGVETYVAGGVVVENYEALHNTATNDRTNATNAVNAIAAPDLNCGDDMAAATEATDKDRASWRDNNLNQTIHEADKSLKTYGKSVNKLFDAAVNS